MTFSQFLHSFRLHFGNSHALHISSFAQQRNAARGGCESNVGQSDTFAGRKRLESTSDLIVELRVR